LFDMFKGDSGEKMTPHLAFATCRCERLDFCPDQDLDHWAGCVTRFGGF
jgi:hypothetical protein